MPAPIVSPGTAELNAVAVVSATDAWAVGATSSPATSWFDRPLILRWNGTAWASVPVPAFTSVSRLYGVAVVSPNDVWAVGTALESNWRTVTLRWNGSAWSRVPSPNADAYGNQLSGVAAAGANDVWAVGSSRNGGNPLIVRWNGTAWTIVPSPLSGRTDVNGHSLRGVSVVSGNDVWAVGTASFSGLCGASDAARAYSYTFAQHWNGANWATIASPSPATGSSGCIGPSNTLAGVARIATDDVWAVGVAGSATLTERYTVP